MINVKLYSKEVTLETSIISQFGRIQLLHYSFILIGIGTT